MHERTYMRLSVLAINIANADAADVVDIYDGIMRVREREREGERERERESKRKRERDVSGLVPSATFSGKKKEAH